MISMPEVLTRRSGLARVCRAGALLMMLIALGGCGKKGPLYLPGETPPPPSPSAPAG